MFRVLGLLAGLACLNACSTLQSVSLPDENASAPSSAPLWLSLEEIRNDNWNILLNDGPGALDWRLSAIDSATQSIDLQTFLWSVDTVGSAMLNHLLTAADRGVRVRLLIDDSFLYGEDDLAILLAEHPLIEYRVFNPYKRRMNGFVTREVLNLGEFQRLNHRMHNKVMVVDNRVAFVGGRNLADEYFGLHRATNFRDMELIVGGPVVPEISDAFDRYWNDDWSIPVEMLTHMEPGFQRLTDRIPTSDADTAFHRELRAKQLGERWRRAVAGAIAGTPRILVDDPPEADPTAESSAPVQLAQELIALFDSAREEVLIVSAYLIPSPRLQGAVARAVERGVRVRILTNSIRSNNHITAHSAYRNHIGDLMNEGVELHEMRVDARDRRRYMIAPADKKSLALHAKVLVVDYDRVFIGSANLDPRSLRINTEVGLLVDSEALNRRLRDDLEPDFLGANAWSLQFDEAGEVVWVSDTVTVTEQPAGSYMQRIEDWFFAHLPIEEQM
jgi:putative cardiolipin synthase